MLCLALLCVVCATTNYVEHYVWNGMKKTPKSKPLNDRPTSFASFQIKRAQRMCTEKKRANKIGWW